MALPASIDPTKPLGTDQKKDGDDQIRALKQFIVDILGLPVEPTDMTAAIMDANADGTIASSLSIALKAVANVFTADQEINKATATFIIDSSTDNPIIRFRRSGVQSVALGGTSANQFSIFDSANVTRVRWDLTNSRLLDGIVPLARIEGYLEASVILDFGNIAAHGVSTTSITVTGAQMGDYVLVSSDVNIPLALQLVGRMLVINTVRITMYNTATTSSSSGGSQKIRVKVITREA